MIFNITKEVDTIVLIEKIEEYQRVLGEIKYLIMSHKTILAIEKESAQNCYCLNDKEAFYTKDIYGTVIIMGIKVAICEALKFGEVDLV